MMTMRLLSRAALAMLLASCGSPSSLPPLSQHIGSQRALALAAAAGKASGSLDVEFPRGYISYRARSMVFTGSAVHAPPFKYDLAGANCNPKTPTLSCSIKIPTDGGANVVLVATEYNKAGGAGKVLARNSFRQTVKRTGGKIVASLTATASVAPMVGSNYFATVGGTLWAQDANAGTIGTVDPVTLKYSPVWTCTICEPGGESDQGLGPMTQGSDGNLWAIVGSIFQQSVLRLTPGGSATLFTPVPYSGSTAGIMIGIASGPDGNLWIPVTRGGGNLPIAEIVKLSTSGSALAVYTHPSNYSSSAEPVFDPKVITAGPDGNMWFTSGAASDHSGFAVGKIAMNGAVTLYPLRPVPESNESYSAPGIVSAGDGNLWIIDPYADDPGCSLDKVTTSGTITNYPLELALSKLGTLYSLAVVPSDPGGLWLSYVGTNIASAAGLAGIQRISTAGKPSSQLVTQSVHSFYVGSMTSLTLGPDGNLWYDGGIGGISRFVW